MPVDPATTDPVTTNPRRTPATTPRRTRRRRTPALERSGERAPNPRPRSGAPPPGRRAAQTRRLLLEAAGQLFAEQGYHATTVPDIVKAAGVGHGTFYEYFGSRHQILLALTQQAIESHGNGPRLQSTNLAERIRSEIFWYLAEHVEHLQLWKVWHEASSFDADLAATRRAERARRVKRCGAASRPPVRRRASTWGWPPPRSTPCSRSSPTAGSSRATAPAPAPPTSWRRRRRCRRSGCRPSGSRRRVPDALGMASGQRLRSSRSSVRMASTACTHRGVRLPTLGDGGEELAVLQLDAVIDTATPRHVDRLPVPSTRSS